jgi:predicted NACHT family NTPase
MSVEPRSLESTLGRQRDPEPPSQVPVPAPSLGLYVVLLAIACVLIAFALASGTQDWPAFSLNLASEIVGAVIILIVVDRRLRARELRAIQRAREETRLRFYRAVSPQCREVSGFAQVLAAQLEAVAKPYHLPRPRIEADVFAALERGAVVEGGAGSGKTTILHRAVLKKAIEAMREPTKTRVPIIVSGARWVDGTAEEVLFETMRGYYPVSPKVFDRLLAKGRILGVFDGIDESLRPEERVEAIREFLARYPRNAVVLTTRSAPDARIRELGLESLEVPVLTEEERRQVLELRERFSPSR